MTEKSTDEEQNPMGYYYGSLAAPFMKEEVQSLLREATQSGLQPDSDESMEDKG